MAILICFFLVLIIPYATSITFDFPNISQNLQDKFRVSNETYVSDEGIQVTPETRYGDKIAGRATYIEELHLWDKTSGELASFDTEFSFVIDSNMNKDYGDGLTFFLAENNTLITSGASLGLPVDDIKKNTIYPVVAVEFDTFWNDICDPNVSSVYNKPHVGIDVNSLVSVKYEQWMNNVSAGSECKAYIKYDSLSNNISVSVFDEMYVVVELNHIIDLRDVLPEWVIFGFSAATGGQFEKHTVKSWKFNSSNLHVDEEEVKPPTTSPDNSSLGNASKNSKGKNKTGLVVGIIAGVVFAFSVQYK